MGTKGRLVERTVLVGDPAWPLAQAAIILAQSGFLQYQIVAWILCGIEPVLPRATVAIDQHTLTLPISEYGTTSQWITRRQVVVTLRTPDIKLGELQALASEIRARWQAIGVSESREEITEDDHRLHKILATTGWLDSSKGERVLGGFWTDVLKQWTDAGWGQVTRQALMMRARRLKQKLSQVPLENIRRLEDTP